VTIASIKSGAIEGVRRIALSDGSFFSFNICYLPPVFRDECFSGLENTENSFEGFELTSAEEEGLRFASACLRAEKAALQLITRAEQYVLGLTRKLKKRGHSSDCAYAVIFRLCELGLLDDQRYARLWLAARASRQSSSPRRLLIALCARGIDRNDADAAFKAVLDGNTELLLLQRYVEKLRRKRKISDYDGADARRSLKYLLKNEGFSTLAIQLFFGD
jgi:regulatory protein